mgnify:CR=1 FL=1|tara:strand:+ start:1240 stop:1716 length:477 start_codon:yes stop_codon:yes gene_type:complete
MQSRIKPKNKQNFFQKFLILLYFGFFSINSVKANPITLEGVASAIDGDTIIINNYKIRLNGVSAPELSEEGGDEAKQAMQKILANKTIKCSLSGRKSYERYIGVCWIGAVDVGALLVLQGFARDCFRYSGGRYSALEPGPAQYLPLPQYCLASTQKTN